MNTINRKFRSTITDIFPGVYAWISDVRCSIDAARSAVGLIARQRIRLLTVYPYVIYLNSGKRIVGREKNYPSFGGALGPEDENVIQFRFPTTARCLFNNSAGSFLRNYSRVFKRPSVFRRNDRVIKRRFNRISGAKKLIRKTLFAEPVIRASAAADEVKS